jgi:hypothetical protein
LMIIYVFKNHEKFLQTMKNVCSQLSSVCSQLSL